MKNQRFHITIACIVMFVVVATLHAFTDVNGPRMLTSNGELVRIPAIEPLVEDTLNALYDRDTTEGVIHESGRVYVATDSGWVFFNDHGYAYDTYMESFTFANVSPLAGDELIIVLNNVSNGSRGGGTTSSVGVYSLSEKLMLMSAEIGEEFSWFDGTGYRYCRRPFEFKDSTMFLLPLECTYGEDVAIDEPYFQDTIAIPMWLD